MRSFQKSCRQTNNFLPFCLYFTYEILAVFLGFWLLFVFVAEKGAPASSITCCPEWSSMPTTWRTWWRSERRPTWRRRGEPKICFTKSCHSEELFFVSFLMCTSEFPYCCQALNHNLMNEGLLSPFPTHTRAHTQTTCDVLSLTDFSLYAENSWLSRHCPLF